MPPKRNGTTRVYGLALSWLRLTSSGIVVMLAHEQDGLQGSPLDDGVDKKKVDR